MEVECTQVMGPERVLPSSEEDLGQERESEPVVEEWSGEDGEGEDGAPGEEEEEEDTTGYYYQPLNQEPDAVNSHHTEQQDEQTHADQLQEVQERIEAMGLFLPQPPAPDSDEEDPEGAAACSHASIPMDPDHVELVKKTMAAVNLPSLGIPAWAREISDDQWEDMVQKTLQSRQSSAGLLLQRK